MGGDLGNYVAPSCGGHVGAMWVHLEPTSLIRAAVFVFVGCSFKRWAHQVGKLVHVCFWSFDKCVQDFVGAQKKSLGHFEVVV